MAAATSISLELELARLGVLHGTQAILPSRSVLALGWPELDDALPDHGLPHGVIEIASMPRNGTSSRLGLYPDSMRGGGTSIAIAAMSATHAADAKAWCAWITAQDSESASLYAPSLAHAGVDLDRLLIVRPSVKALARTVVKVAASGAFGLVVVDAPGRYDLAGGPHTRSGDNGAIVVRKLALAAEESGTTSLLLTSALTPRAMPWPVALRMEVERRPDALSVRITKDRRGCGSSQHVVRLAS